MFEAHFQTFEEPEGGVALTARLARSARSWRGAS